MENKIKINVSRHFAPHRMLLDTALKSIQEAEKGNNVSSGLLTVLLLSSLSLEAVANAYGETLIPDWKDYESCSPMAKFRLIWEIHGLEYNAMEKKWITAKGLYRFRNKIVHAKIEKIKVQSESTATHYHDDFYRKPESKLEKMISDEFARRSIDCIYSILESLAEITPTEKIVELELESWTGGASMP